MPSPVRRPASDVARDVRNAADNLVGAGMIVRDRLLMITVTARICLGAFEVAVGSLPAQGRVAQSIRTFVVGVTDRVETAITALKEAL